MLMQIQMANITLKKVNNDDFIGKFDEICSCSLKVKFVYRVTNLI